MEWVLLEYVGPVVFAFDQAAPYFAPPQHLYSTASQLLELLLFVP